MLKALVMLYVTAPKKSEILVPLVVRFNLPLTFAKHKSGKLQNLMARDLFLKLRVYRKKLVAGKLGGTNRYHLWLFYRGFIADHILDYAKLEPG